MESPSSLVYVFAPISIPPVSRRYGLTGDVDQCTRRVNTLLRDMVSCPETIPSRLSMTSSEPTNQEILERLVVLEQENKKLPEENKRLRAKLRWYEGSYTPPSKEQSGDEESSSSLLDEDDKQPRTDGGTPGRNPGYDPECRAGLIQIGKSRSPATAVQSVVNSSTSRGLTPANSSRNSRIRNLQKSHSTTVTTTSANPVGPELSLLTPTAPMRGSSG